MIYQTLDLSENHLTKVPPLLPVNVEFLYLQNNAIARLSKEAFRLTPKLRGKCNAAEAIPVQKLCV